MTQCKQSPLAKFARVVFAQWPNQLTSLVALVLISGLLEGVGFTLFIPLIRQLKREAATGWLDKAIRFLHLQDSFLFLLLFILGIFAVKNLCLYFYKWYSSKIAIDFEVDLRKKIINSVHGADWQHFLTQKVGHITNVIGLFTKNSSNALVMLSSFVSEVLYVAIYCALGFALSWQTFTFSIVLGLVCMTAIRGLIHRSRAVGLEAVEIGNQVQSQVTDDLLGLKFLKGNRLEGKRNTKLFALFESLGSTELKGFRYAALMETVPDFIMAVVMCVILYFSQSFFSVPGDRLIVLMAVLYRLNRQLMTLQTTRQRLVLYLPAYEFIEELINSNHTRQEKTGALQFEKLEGPIRLQDVSFSYSNIPVLQRVTMELPMNRVVALVGKSGSGKTTMLDLLTGLLKVQSGDLLLNNRSVADYDIFSWREKIAYVSQEPYVLSATLKENLTFGLKNCSFEKVEAACSMAHVDQFMDQLPKGYDSELGERGNRLSGGQKQRIALARALLREPELLILDEATSSLDAESEKLIYDAVRSLKGKMTIFLVAHRSKLVDLADIIYVIHEGKIVDSGTKEYLQAHSLYFKQFSVQA